MSRKTKQVQASESFKPGPINFEQLTQDAIINQLKTDLLREQEKCVALSMTIDQLLNQVASKEEEIIHLKQLLISSTPAIGEVMPLMVTDEEEIALRQLQKLKDAAKMRELTLDEIKKFDLLVKNKRLAQGDATNINTEKLPKSLAKDQLLQIAQKKTKEEN